MKQEETFCSTEIEWDITDEILERDSEERLIVKVAYGEDKEGKKYSGSAKFICGELEEIEDIIRID